MACRNDDVMPKPFAVSPKKAEWMLDIGHTQVYELLARDELKSFWIGRSRKITVQSIEEYIARKLAEASEASPKPRAESLPAEKSNFPMPNEAEWLALTEHSPLTVTHGKNGPRYSLQDGTTVPSSIALALIKKGLVEPCGDELFGGSQTYRVPRLEQDGV